MSSGKRDYWHGLDFGKATYSNFQTPYYECWFVDITDEGAMDTILTFTPDTGYRLHITNCQVSSNFPAIHIVYLTMEGVSVRTSFFDLNFMFPPTDSGDLVIEAGNEVTLKVRSGTDEDCRFWGSLTGFLEQIT